MPKVKILLDVILPDNNHCGNCPCIGDEYIACNYFKEDLQYTENENYSMNIARLDACKKKFGEIEED